MTGWHVTITRSPKAGKIKMLVGWTSISNFILVFTGADAGFLKGGGSYLGLQAEKGVQL